MKLWKLSACVLALVVAACGGGTGTEPQVEQETSGSVKLPLVSATPDASGKFYRLVGATFEITGPQSVSITDTAMDVVQTTLLAGEYTVQLGGTWHMESLDAPGVVVPAQLLSPNPLGFLVSKGETTEVRFQFKLAGQGSADVGFKVDNGGWISGTIQFIAREDGMGTPSMFDELVGQTVPFLVSFESLTQTKDTWSRTLYVDGGPTPSTLMQFGGPYSATLTQYAQAFRGAMFPFSLRTISGSDIEFSGIMTHSYMEPYAFELWAPPPFQGVTDADGYPIFRAFDVTTTVIFRNPKGEAVRGEAILNIAP